MILKVFIVITLQLLCILSVNIRKPQNDLLAAFRMKHSVEEKEEKIILDKPKTNHGQSTVINTILSRIFPNRVKVDMIILSD